MAEAQCVADTCVGCGAAVRNVLRSGGDAGSMAFGDIVGGVIADAGVESSKYKGGFAYKEGNGRADEAHGWYREVMC